MPRVPLNLLKKQVAAEEFEDDDDLLESCLMAAEEQVLNAIEWRPRELSGIPDWAFPATLRHAMLMRAATLYRYHEDVETQAAVPIPLATQALIMPYHRLRGGGLMEELVAQYPPET